MRVKSKVKFNGWSRSNSRKIKQIRVEKLRSQYENARSDRAARSGQNLHLRLSGQDQDLCQLALSPVALRAVESVLIPCLQHIEHTDLELLGKAAK